MDELNSQLGLVRMHLDKRLFQDLDADLYEVQCLLIELGTHISNPGAEASQDFDDNAVKLEYADEDSRTSLCVCVCVSLCFCVCVYVCAWQGHFGSSEPSHMLVHALPCLLCNGWSDCSQLFSFDCLLSLGMPQVVGVEDR